MDGQRAALRRVAAADRLAYRTLKRRMRVLGIEIPPPEEFMPGPIGEPSEPRATVPLESGPR